MLPPKALVMIWYANRLRLLRRLRDRGGFELSKVPFSNGRQGHLSWSPHYSAQWAHLVVVVVLRAFRLAALSDLFESHSALFLLAGSMYPG